MAVGRALAVAACISAAGCGGHTTTTTTSAPASPTATRTETVTTFERTGGASFDPQAIYKQRAPGVVTIVSLSGNGGANALGRAEAALGSGFVTDAAGDIATNAHVVESSGGRAAKTVYVEFANGNRLPARIVGTDDNSDIALLKVDPSQLRGPGARLDPLPFGSTGGLTVGDPVAAIGSPFGEEQSLSVGVVSALNRDIQSLTRFPIGNAIQTDAAINHGNSGGPLLDASGHVIGVNSQIESSGGGGEGVGFAIPVETVKRSVAQLRAKGHVDYAYLGISTLQLYPQLAERLKVPVATGVLVDTVRPGSPGKRAGLRGAHGHIDFQGANNVPVGSDVIVAVDGHELTSAVDLSDVIARHQPGETAKLTIIRDGRRRTLSVTLGARPGQSG